MDHTKAYALEAGSYTFYIKEQARYTGGVPTSFKYDCVRNDDQSPCMTVTVETPHKYALFRGRDPKYDTMHTISNIQWISFHPSCSITPPLLRGEGTRTMVRAVLSFVVQKHPWIETFTLTDMSTIDCNGHNAQLMFLSMALNAATWYTKHFGALPQFEPIRALYSANMGRWTDPAYKREWSWDQFSTVFDMPAEVVAAVQEEYAGADTFQALFQRLSRRFPVGSPNALCDVFYKEVVPGKAWGALVVTGICGLDYQALQGDWCISVSGFEVMRHTAREVTDMAVFQDVARLQTMVGGYHMRFFPQMRKGWGKGKAAHT